MIDIQFDDSTVAAAFARLAEAGANLRPFMADVGELLSETTKQRFATSTSPDGTPWEPNTPLTITLFLNRFGGSYKKDGGLSKKGEKRAGGKKPLIGETGALSTTISYQAGPDFVVIGSPMGYAGTQQFGAKARSFAGGRSPWGDVPARPFLGISNDDERGILDLAMEHLDAAAS